MKKNVSIHVSDLIYAAAKERLDEAGWNNIDFAVEYFLAECVVRKRLPSFLNNRRSCAVCKFYESIHKEKFREKLAMMQKRAKEGKYFTALLHPAREGGFWCEIPALEGCVSQGSTVNEAKYMIKDAALGWLDVKDVNIRYRIQRESKRNADLFMFNSPEAERNYRSVDEFLKDMHKLAKLPKPH